MLMIRGALFRQRGKMLLIAFTIALGTSLATAMLNVMLDVGDKVNQELKTYGANITVKPKDSSLLSDLYDVEDDGDVIQTSYLKEEEVGKLKTIFWAFNIVDFAPFIDTGITLADGNQVKLVGTWFNHHLELPTGENLDVGVTSLRTWWDITEGSWLDEQTEGTENAVMIGAVLAEREGWKVGDAIFLEGPAGSCEAVVAGVFDAGGDEDEQIYAPLDLVQELSDTEGKVPRTRQLCRQRTMRHGIVQLMLAPSVTRFRKPLQTAWRLRSARWLSLRERFWTRHNSL